MIREQTALTPLRKNIAAMFFLARAERRFPLLKKSFTRLSILWLEVLVAQNLKFAVVEGLDPCREAQAEDVEREAGGVFFVFFYYFANVAFEASGNYTYELPRPVIPRGVVVGLHVGSELPDGALEQEHLSVGDDGVGAEASTSVLKAIGHGAYFAH